MKTDCSNLSRFIIRPLLTMSKYSRDRSKKEDEKPPTQVGRLLDSFVRWSGL